ncbi:MULTISPECIES: PmoA family protein [unclassified Streptomyces]|uniref:DUF6807 domain-containing protein n=1 Tax=unclassified Streptomyces TaxID=2593676 RepID=UPI000DDBB00B|nr:MULTISPECIES: PmoA family protein [unclassified Streptomyces]QZZ27653.1 oxidoreductase [Streptomyces sp. ST1015]
MAIRVSHVHGEYVAVEAANGVEIMRYVYRPDPEAYEARKPYAHPLRTLGGRLVSGYRPSDHRWHKGLQMTASHLSGQNFWGGHSYVHGEGYLDLPDIVGSMRHDGFTDFTADEQQLAFTEELTWIENGGAEWARETRGVRVHSVDEAAGAWALDWSIRLTNLRDVPLAFGSPTTAGRELAGYTGLHWRGPRDFTGGAAFAPEGDGAEKLMGTRSRWLAYSGEHDDVDGHSTLVFEHGPDNDATHHWFVRAEPIPTVSFSWAFFEEFELPPGESFAYRYRVVFADGAWDRERVTGHLAGLGWT